MSADALVCDAARAPVDVMLPMCILQILSFHWCRFLSYSCTVCMSRNVRKFSVPCVTSVTWTNLSLYLIITWRINRQHDDLTVPWGYSYMNSLRNTQRNSSLNTFRLEHNYQHFADGIFKLHFPEYKLLYFASNFNIKMPSHRYRNSKYNENPYSRPRTWP